MVCRVFHCDSFDINSIHAPENDQIWPHGISFTVAKSLSFSHIKGTLCQYAKIAASGNLAVASCHPVLQRIFLKLCFCPVRITALPFLKRRGIAVSANGAAGTIFPPVSINRTFSHYTDIFKQTIFICAVGIDQGPGPGIGRIRV